MIADSEQRLHAMDIRHVSGNGNVERPGDRSRKAEPKVVLIPAVGRDEAKISSTGRQTAAAVAGLAARARQAGGEREAIVAAAAAKLQRGELDGEPVAAATAERMLAARFLSG